MKLTTKQLKQMIKEELRHLHEDDDEEMQQMAQLISGDNIQSVKSGLNQLVIGGIADMLGVRVLDLIDTPDVNRDLVLHVKWFEKVMDLKSVYHSKEIVDKSLPDWTREDTQEYARHVKEIIEEFWWHLSKIWSQKQQSEFLPGNVWQTTQDWSSSYAGDVLLDIADGKMIYNHNYYGGADARTPKPGEDSFVTGFLATQDWLTSILSMMKEDPIWEQLLREY